MKTSILCVVLVIFLGAGDCYAQTNQKISVPVLKESAKIDSLMDMILSNLKTYNIPSKISKDSCWRIEIFKFKENATSFQIVENEKTVANYEVNQWVDGKVNYGYFQYRGYNIFVRTDSEFYNFLYKTQEEAIFSFIYKLNTSEPRPSLERLYYNPIHSKYEGGAFSGEGPPPVTLALVNNNPQTGQSLPLTVIKESKTIDSLMDMVIKDRAKYNKANSKLSTNGCWRIEIFEQNGNPVLQIVESDEHVANYMINKSWKDVNSYGYFQYRGCKIFVGINGYFHDFFTGTTETWMFDFIYKLKGDEQPPATDKLFNHPKLYQYADGHFSSPPPVVLVH